MGMSIRLFIYTSMDTVILFSKYLLSFSYNVNLRMADVFPQFVRLPATHPPPQETGGRGRPQVMSLHPTQPQPLPQRGRANPSHAHRGKEGCLNPGEGEVAFGGGGGEQACDHIGGLSRDRYGSTPPRSISKSWVRS